MKIDMQPDIYDFKYFQLTLLGLTAVYVVYTFLMEPFKTRLSA